MIKYTFVSLVFALALMGCTKPEEAASEQKQTAQVEEKAQADSTNEVPATPTVLLPEVTDEQKKVRFDDGIKLGDPDAQYAVIEFTDYQCPYCATFHKETFSKIKEEFIDKGELLFVARDLPLHQIHPVAPMAAVVARCAAEQDKYWEVKESFFANQDKLALASLIELATVDGIDLVQMEACTNGRDAKVSVQNSAVYAARMGLTSTPTLLIGRSLGDGIVDVVKISGAKNFEVFKEAFTAAKELANK